MLIVTNIISGKMRPTKYRQFDVAVYNNSGHYFYETFISHFTSASHLRSKQITKGALKTADCKVCDAEVHDHYTIFLNESRINVESSLDFMEDCLIVKYWVEHTCLERNRQFVLTRNIETFTRAVSDPDYTQLWPGTAEEVVDAIDYYQKQKRHPSRMYLDVEEVLPKVVRFITIFFTIFKFSTCLPVVNEVVTVFLQIKNAA